MDRRGQAGGRSSDQEEEEVLIPGLTLGPLRVDSPVVLAPMAGITNAAYRRLCLEQMHAQGSTGLFVCEMITSRGLVEGDATTRSMLVFDELEDVRSVQLYGTDPAYVGKATEILCAEYGVAHVDLNFGCPVPKVTRKGGGAALPWKLTHFREIVEGAVAAAGSIPLTVKMRKGIDSDHLTYIEAAKAAEGAGVASIALHARTAAEFYSGHADWSAIAKLKETITGTPVLGNGDIWSAADAIRMVEETGCDGVVVGRGCLGRPWLFGDLAAAFRARAGEISAEEAERAQAHPTLGQVAATFRRHAELLVEFFESEERGCRDIRKHVAWYFKGYPVGGDTRARLATASSLAEIDDLLATLDLDAPYPGAAAEGQRGRAGSPKKPALPEGWLNSRELDGASRAEVAEAEVHNSGG